MCLALTVSDLPPSLIPICILRFAMKEIKQNLYLYLKLAAPNSSRLPHNTGAQPGNQQAPFSVRPLPVCRKPVSPYSKADSLYTALCVLLLIFTSIPKEVLCCFHWKSNI